MITRWLRDQWGLWYSIHLFYRLNSTTIFRLHNFYRTLCNKDDQLVNIIITINRGGEIEALRMSANTRLTTCHYLAISCHGEATFPDVIISHITHWISVLNENGVERKQLLSSLVISVNCWCELKTINISAAERYELLVKDSAKYWFWQNCGEGIITQTLPWTSPCP